MQGATHEPPPHLRGGGVAGRGWGWRKELFTRKVALLVVSVGLATALVVSMPQWTSAVGAQPNIMWRSPARGGSSGSAPLLRDSGGWAGPSLTFPPPASPDAAAAAAASSETNPACRFDYPGPLRPESLDCYAEYFPGAQPFAYPRTATAKPGRSFSLSGVQWEAGEDGAAAPPRVPIIVLFKDRVSVLIETLRSFWRYIGTPYEVIIFNDNSTYPDAVRFLDRLAASGVHVHDNPRAWRQFDELFEIVADFVDIYTKASKSPYYILTDPDCALDSAPWNILQVYQHALETLDLTAVGTALRWDDFPESLTLAYEGNVAKLPPKALLYNDRNYYYIDAPVDTTFAMFRTGPRLKRLRGKHVRMLPPLGARHLDFYLEKDRLPEDYKYYHSVARAKAVNHMGHLDGAT